MSPMIAQSSTTPLLCSARPLGSSMAYLPSSSNSRQQARCSSTHHHHQQRRRQVPAAAAAGQRQQQLAAPLAAALAAAGIALPATAGEAFGEASSAAAAAAAVQVAPATPAASEPVLSAAFAAAQEAAAADPTDALFTALFTIAIGALSVVTLGVAYLSYTSWNDSRLEAEDRRRVESFRPSASTGAKKEASKKAAAPAKEPEEYKGFGKR